MYMHYVPHNYGYLVGIYIYIQQHHQEEDIFSSLKDLPKVRIMSGKASAATGFSQPGIIHNLFMSSLIVICIL